MLIDERKEGGFLAGEWRETGIIAGEWQQTCSHCTKNQTAFELF